jgi:hypothetical protein
MTVAICMTKKGERLWLSTATNQPNIGRREIARFQFDRYLLKKLMKGE